MDLICGISAANNTLKTKFTKKKKSSQLFLEGEGHTDNGDKISVDQFAPPADYN
jgi:hypothetical protein